MKASFSLCKTLLALVALISCATFAQAQNREKFGISAKAGGVNAVSGKVTVASKDQAPRLLTSQDDLASGDIVSTGLGSQVEVLLNPGTYLRLAESSEFVMEDTSLDNLLVRLTKGSAIIEATGPDQLQLSVPVVTAEARFTILRAGIYRINATKGATELIVRKGRVELNGTQTRIKGGQKVTITSTGETVAKLTKDDKDQFDDWSKTRGQTLARANTKLNPRTVNGYLTSGYGSYGFSRFGLWTWSSFSSCYTFLPYYYGWGSPYGSYYGAFFNHYGGYYGGGYGYPGGGVVTHNSSGGGSGGGYPGGGTSGGSSGGMGSGGSGSGGGGYRPPSGGASYGPSAPSMAGPRDPDSGSRMINTIKPPIN